MSLGDALEKKEKNSLSVQKRFQNKTVGNGIKYLRNTTIMSVSHSHQKLI